MIAKVRRRFISVSIVIKIFSNRLTFLVSCPAPAACPCALGWGQSSGMEVKRNSLPLLNVLLLNQTGHFLEGPAGLANTLGPASRVESHPTRESRRQRQRRGA